MAYITILDTQLDPDAPITSSLGYQLRDNPVEIASGASGAPRIADPTFSHGRGSSGTTVLNPNGEYGGLWAEFSVAAGSAGADTTQFTIAASDDGVTYSSELSLGNLITDKYKSGRLFLDFTAGAYKIITTVSDTILDHGNVTTGTVGSWPAGAITHVRFTTTIVGTGKTGALGRFCGGEAVL